MIKLNNKGFAISTLLYGLILMMFLIVLALMSILGSTRKNTKNLVDTIDQELKNVDNENAEFVYDGTNGDFKYTVPTSGWYKIVLVEPATVYHGQVMKHGSYTTGIVYLQANIDIYIHLGKSNMGEDLEAYMNYDEDSKNRTFLKSPQGTLDITPLTNFKEPVIMGYAGTSVSDELQTLPELKPVMYNTQIFLNSSDDWRGSAKINKISDNSPVDVPVAREANSGLDQVRYIKDCTTGSTAGNSSAWTEIQAIDSNGINVAKGKNVVSEGGNDPSGKITAITDGLIKEQDSNHIYENNDKNNADAVKCVIVDLGAAQNLNEVAVWHYHSDRRIYKNHNLQVGESLDSLRTIGKTFYTSYQAGPITTTINTGEPETIMGMRYNRFSPNSSVESTLPDGKYFIIHNTIYKNKLLTSQNNTLTTPLFKTDFALQQLQQWNVISNGDGTYRIVNISDNNGIERSGNNLICNNPNDSIKQHWKIEPADRGGYKIMSIDNSSPPFYYINSEPKIEMGAGPNVNNLNYKFIRVQ